MTRLRSLRFAKLFMEIFNNSVDVKWLFVNTLYCNFIIIIHLT